MSVHASTAHAQRPKRVGIVVTVLVNLNEAEGRALADALGEAIQEEFAVDVISGVETERRLPDGGVPDECVANVDCRNDLGRRLDADELLMLVMLRLGEDIQIDSTWTQVASGDSASRAKVVVNRKDDRARVFREAAPGLLPHIEKKTAEVAPAARPEIIFVPPPTKAPSSEEVPLGTWISGGLSVAALVGGTVFALSAREKFTALDDEGCRTMSCETGRIDALRDRALIADLLLGASGGAAATAIIFYLAAPSPESTSKPAAHRLRRGPGSIGFALGGDF